MAIIASETTTSRPLASRVATAVLALVSVGIVLIGARFLLQPDAAAVGFGLVTSPDEPFLAVKGDRDIGAGLVLGVVLALAGGRVAGWAGIAAAVMPLGDMIVVLTRGGPVVTALAVHGATCLVMVAAGATLVLDARRRA